MSESRILPALPTQFDIVEASLNAAVAVVFPKSRSGGYDAAVNFARQADAYDETTVGKTLYHFAVFGRTREQAARVLAVIRNLRGAKGFQVIARGRLVDWARVAHVLECYLIAASLPDWRAHCVEMVPATMLEHGPRVSSVSISIDLSAPRWFRTESESVPFPCRYLLQRQFRFQPSHPSSKDDQLKAGAAQEGCDWCPYFLKNQEGRE